MRGVIYSRLSVEDRDSMSIENQNQLCMDYAANNKIHIVKLYSDFGASGKDMNRPGIQELFDDMDKKLFDVVICKDISRFSRNMNECLMIIGREFVYKNIRFIAVNDGYDSYVAKDNFELLIRSFVYDYYLKECSRKIKKVLAKKGKTKSLSSGCYGYKLINSKLEIIPEQAEVVKYIFHSYLSGIGVTAIANELENKLYPSPKSIRFKIDYPWTKAAVIGILRNEIYTGTAVNFKSISVEYKQRDNPESNWVKIANNHEAIISYDIYNAVQRKRLDKTKSFQKTGLDKLKGMVICEKCNKKMQFSYSRRNGKIFSKRYFCNNCKMKINADEFHDALYNDLLDIIEKIDLKAIDRKISEKTKKKQSINKELEMIKANIIKQHKILLNDLITGIITEAEYKEKVIRLDDEEKEFEEKKSFVRNQHDDTETLKKDFMEFIQFIKAKKFNKIELIKEMVDKILIKEGEVEIIYKFEILN